MRSLIVVMVLAASAVAGTPVLEPTNAGALTVKLPKGWKVTPSTGAATIVVAQQDPARADAAAMLVSVQLTGNTSTDDQLVDAVAKQIAKDLKVTKREPLPGGGGKLLVGEGTAGGIKVRVGAIAIVSGASAVIGVLAAKPADFDALGGTALIVSVLGSISANAPAQAQPAQPVADAPAAPSNGRITIADLAGTWDNDSGSVKQYATSSGQYAGAEVVSMHKIYTIAANGDYTEKFSGYMGGTASGGGSFAWKTYTGKFSFTPKGVLEITQKGYDSNYYTIMSLTTSGQVSTLMLSVSQNRDDPPSYKCPCEKLYRVNAKK